LEITTIGKEMLWQNWLGKKVLAEKVVGRKSHWQKWIGKSGM